MKTVEATVVEELPGLLYRLELENKAQVLAHGSLAAPAGQALRNWVRLLPGDRVEVEFAERDLTRGRITKKL
jgi:translation initiation factor IF-1